MSSSSRICCNDNHLTSNTSNELVIDDSPSNMDVAAEKLQMYNRERFTHTHGRHNSTEDLYNQHSFMISVTDSVSD